MKLVKEHINEKFTEDSDPIEDLGIGFSALKKFWKKEHKKEGETSPIQSAEEYYGNKEYSNEAYAVYTVLDEIVFADVNSQKDIQKAFEKAIIKVIYRYHYPNIKLDKVIWALKKFFRIYVESFNPKPLPLHEKFSEDSDPISDLNIGIIHEIKDFYDDNSILGAEYDDWIALLFSIDHNKYEFIQYFIDSEYFQDSKKLLGLRYAIFGNNLTATKLFLKAGFKVKDALSARDVLRLRGFYKIGRQLMNIVNDVFPLEEFSKNLDEKFTEDSDPIEDLGIGIMSQIKRYFEENYIHSLGEKYKCDIKDRMLLFCVDNKKYQYAKALLDGGANVHTSGGIHNTDHELPLRYAVWNDDLKMTKLLLKYGASVMTAFGEDEIKSIMNAGFLGHLQNGQLKKLIIQKANK